MLSIKDKIGLDFEFWDAVTSSEITEQDKNQYFKYVNFYEWDIIPEAAMATFMSHINLLKWSVNRKTNLILIEDDIDHINYFDWDSLDWDTFDVYKLGIQGINCYAYAVSHEGADKLLKHFNSINITEAYDIELHKIKHLKVKYLKTPIFVQLLNKFESNIAPNGYKKKKSMITEIKNFISEEENLKLKEYFNRDLISFESTNSSNFLVADGIFINPIEDNFLKNLLDRMLISINKDWRYVDNVNFIKYDTGGKFKSHSDFIDPTTSANLEDLKIGGQREHTFLIYLNDDYVGGETHFNLMNKTIVPEKNKMIWWKNTLPDGSQNMATVHESKKITTGIKYLFGIWVRQQMVHTIKTMI
jgi:GR25 family glycosyltransferase involved in LPS biosynthesis